MNMEKHSSLNEICKLALLVYLADLGTISHIEMQLGIRGVIPSGFSFHWAFSAYQVKKVVLEIAETLDTLLNNVIKTIIFDDSSLSLEMYKDLIAQPDETKVVIDRLVAWPKRMEKEWAFGISYTPAYAESVAKWTTYIMSIPSGIAFHKRQVGPVLYDVCLALWQEIEGLKKEDLPD